MSDVFYKQFVQHWQEVIDLPPQNLGPLTPIYHRLVKRLKVMPWPMLVLGALFVVLSLYLLIGGAITLLTSLLQKGF